MMQSEYLTTAEAAALIGFKPQTLEVWRSKGDGPPFCKIRRLVRYRRDTLLNWRDGFGETLETSRKGVPQPKLGEVHKAQPVEKKRGRK